MIPFDPPTGRRLVPFVLAFGITHAILPAASPAVAAAAEWHVSPVGDDSNPGTEASPFATLERARDAIRDIRARTPADDSHQTIHLASGMHFLSQPLDLDERDHAITFRGPADRSARLHAGRGIPAAAIHPVSEPAIRDRLTPAARDHVVEIDLAAAGASNFKEPPAEYADGGGLPELLLDDRPLPLSRWPNEGNAVMERVLDRGVWSGKPSERRGGVFVAAVEPSREWRPARWQSARTVWVEGYWRVPWDPHVIRVAAIDPTARTITHAAAISGGIGSKYAAKGSLGDGKEPWCAVNLLEEIDTPGEWSLDFDRQVIYLWPPRPLMTTGAAPLMIADRPTALVRLRDTHDVRLERLTIEGGLGDGVEITGGRGNLVAGCLLRNLGGTAVKVGGGSENGVQSCDISMVGEAGIRLSGGDHATLSPCGNFAVNNDVSEVGRRRKTFAAAIHVGATSWQVAQVDSVGCRVARNFLHDLPHSAVLYGGDDNLIEANEVCRIALTSGDVGAFYSGQDWTSRGNVLRRNFVHDCPRANAFYVDDGDSGDTIEENVVFRSACGPFIGGGHDNIVRRNLVADCPVGIHLDSRGVSRGYATNARYLTRVSSLLESARWRERFPGMARLVDPSLDATGVVGMPHGNVLTENVTIHCGTALRLSGKPQEFLDTRIADNVDLGADAKRCIVDEKGEFVIDPAAECFRSLPSFPSIARRTIGLEQDAFRTRLPAPTRSAAEGHSPGFDSLKDVDATNRASNAP